MNDEVRFIYLKESDNWINPAAIRWVEKVPQGLLLSLAGRDGPVFLTGDDAEKLKTFLEDNSL